MNYLMLFGVTVGLMVFAGAIGWWVWFKTRPKKMSWVADVYKLSDAKLDPPKNRKGVAVDMGFDLTRLGFYGTDVLVKEEKPDGLTVYELKRLNRTVSSVKGGVVDADLNVKLMDERLKGRGRVSVLYDEDQCTLMRSGYHEASGSQVWLPMPYDVINALKNDISVRKDRIRRTKDILQAILPYVAIVLGMMFVIGIVYLNADAQIKLAEENHLAMSEFVVAQKDIAEMNKDTVLAMYGRLEEEKRLGVQAPNVNPILE